MNNSAKTNKSYILTMIGLVIMTLTVLTKIVPSTSIAKYSVFVGIAFFFIVEAVEKTPAAESGLQFKTFISDIKKPWVLPLVLLPIATAILTLVIGDLIFKGEFSAHVVGRTDSIMAFDNVLLLVLQVIIVAFGEEIAWRGFFVGKAMNFFPFWLCAVVSSVLFSAAHIAVGSFEVVFYDVATIFIDSLIYAMIYKKTGNCLISIISHILCNATGIVAIFVFM